MNNPKHSYNSTTTQSQISHLKGIVPLRPDEENFVTEWERYQMQVEFINQMAHELEAAIIELKQIASTLNIKEGLRFFPVSVPWIKQQPNNSLILTSRKVDLFRAEREAANIAQALRSKSYGIISKNKVKHLSDDNASFKGIEKKN
ncbi:MAG: hypothetical protein KME64_25655 [Scytonematopsis contorta HA4267-MV1]|jgi:hypothetical protein|nr:hypothetical protein [Scytonematopsis contorta HA4267-MV1]